MKLRNQIFNGNWGTHAYTYRHIQRWFCPTAFKVSFTLDDKGKMRCTLKDF